jgi:hypothetical protein
MNSSIIILNRKYGASWRYPEKSNNMDNNLRGCQFLAETYLLENSGFLFLKVWVLKWSFSEKLR